MLSPMAPRSLVVLLLALPLLAPAARAGYVFRTVDDPTATGDTQVTGITDDGRIIGYAAYPNNTNRSFIATPAAGGGYAFTSYVLPNVDGTFVNGISNGGRLAGSVGVAGSFYGFLGTTAGPGFTALSHGSPGFTFAYGVNDAGAAVGHFSTFVGVGLVDIVVAGFVTTDDGRTYTTLQAPQADKFTLAYGIGPGGTVVGEYRDAAGRTHGYLATPGPGGTYSYTTLDVPGATRTVIHGINAAGQLVGSYDTPGAASRGFVATPAGSGYTFADLVHPDAVHGTFALGVNGSGTVVGYYFDADFNSHGFVAAAVPEPASLGLAAVAALVVCGRRRLARPGR